MKTLLEFSVSTPVFVLEVLGSEKERQYFENIGIRPEQVLTIIKNPAKEHSSQPLIVEVLEARFMIDQEIAQNVIVSHALNHQSIIFGGNKTPQREAILEVLKNFSGHFTLAELTRKVQEQFPEMGEITIYRSLKVLIEKQILEEIDLPNERKKYEVKKGHHEHIFCQNCGNLIEFYNAEMEALQNKIAEEYGVTLLFHNVTLVASSCKECRK